MSGQEEALRVLETDITDPGAVKSGEYLREHVFRHAKTLVSEDRPSLIAALETWLADRSEPRTMLAVDVAGELRLRELASQLQVLRREITESHVFPAWYVRQVDRALSGIGAGGPSRESGRGPDSA
jgi:hypothetical protein